MEVVILLITALSGPIEGAQTGLAFMSADDCRKAKLVVLPLVPYDFKAECVETETPIARPNARQKNGDDHG